MNFKNKRLAAIIVTFLLATSQPFTVTAEKQDAGGILQMEELSVQVMPEYAYHPKDKKRSEPAVLIGYHGTLMNTSDQAQKGKVQLPLPIGEKNFKIGFVADYSSDLQEMTEIEYSLDKKNGVLSWTTTEKIQPGDLYKFVVEFYINPLTVQGDKKELAYSFESFADIGLLNIIFLEPLKSGEMKLDPAPEIHQENPYGMNMFIYQYQGIEPKEKKSFNLSYTRSTTKTTMELMEDMAGDSAKVTTVKPNETMPTGWVFGAVGATTVVSGGVLVLLLKKRKRPSHRKGSPKGKSNELAEKRRQLRAMLAEEKISHQEYEELLKRLGGSNHE
ncbi:hypothetical protein [Bacillus marinisedimentorum]|uniref:hypothetical protein n=1 Tax=Bacillus marinisedimentorum TaxID=1821260 RepID=UPI0008726D3A|nr:hypothetical protein [Bacillus marinisedimentorum]